MISCLMQVSLPSAYSSRPIVTVWRTFTGFLYSQPNVIADGWLLARRGGAVRLDSRLGWREADQG